MHVLYIACTIQLHVKTYYSPFCLSCLFNCLWPSFKLSPTPNKQYYLINHFFFNFYLLKYCLI
ncbi:hypothetical protein GLYMA_06G235600v4 [Glycine max]|uniref:Uncharacterized protein n=1 Tax=Glycine max TaxID=3847 RepID=K7KWX7_SOYBN|nr:hypothetical protein GYH30_016048 [Glycine max]KRH55183.1 hypothetical protein GLYMA_06G235600v4 [Glycine max]